MKSSRWHIKTGLILVLLSLVLSLFHQWMFQEPRTFLFYALLNMAVLPVEILVVSLLINEWITQRERQLLLEKLNMIIGIFFSDVGMELIRRLTAYDQGVAVVREKLSRMKDWAEEDFRNADREIRTHAGQFVSPLESLDELRDFLVEKRPFFLHLLANPTLLDHDSFTQLLWSVLHLTEELASRKNLGQLSARDSRHLAVDIQRAYKMLVTEWLSYMKHLQRAYPYLFSFASRVNPFQLDATPEVVE